MNPTLPSPRRRWDRSWPLWLAVVTIAWAGSALDAGALERMAMTEIVAVEGTEVVLGAGRLAGLNVASQVTLLRESEPIIHPLTGEVLGVPQEPVGTVHIFEVSEHRSRGGIVKLYSEPMAGDLAEFEPVAASAVPEVSTVMQEMEALKATVERVQERDDDLRSYPAFARKAWDEITAMRSYLTSIDQRLVEMEEQQSEDHFRLSSVLSGEYRQDDYKEFTVRYAPDTEVRLRAAGKTLLIEVVGDSLQMEEMATPVSMAQVQEEADSPGLLAMFGFGSGEDDEAEDVLVEEELKPVPVDDLTVDEDVPWYSSVYHLAAGVGLTLTMLIMVFLVIRKRYTDVMEGLEEFDDDEYDSYLEDEDEDDDDE
ncbi:MAG TPA: hypothetical protein QGF95_23330 [Candidatus Latescibacteria bacterium]|jgi:hypothetical protein|nr:hypothetical protein [Candidatus Latescibacterota bacterium]